MLRTADQNSGAEDKQASHDHLERRRQYRRIHPAIADEGDDGKLDDDDAEGDCRRCPEIRDKIGQRVARPPSIVMRPQTAPRRTGLRAR